MMPTADNGGFLGTQDAKLSGVQRWCVHVALASSDWPSEQWLLCAHYDNAIAMT